jgi:hypothetical protein
LWQCNLQTFYNLQPENKEIAEYTFIFLLPGIQETSELPTSLESHKSKQKEN